MSDLPMQNNIRPIITCCILLVVMMGCKNTTEKKPVTTPPAATQPAAPLQAKKFFAYDQIDHYFTTIAEDEVYTIREKPKKTPADTLLLGILTQQIPASMNELAFLSKLEELNFTRKSVPASKFPEMDQLFSEKKVDDILYTKCIHIYRDILVFKKQETITGFAKICFTCMAHKILGTTADTEAFGQEGGYAKLEQLLERNE